MILAKFLSCSGICSRRKAEQLIKSGVVFVNGLQVFAPFLRIDEKNDQVVFQKNIVKPLATEKKRYILFNKPQRLLCSQKSEKGMSTIFDYFKAKGFTEKLISVGRLDFLSEGVLLLTNDGNFANILAHPAHKIEKNYKVTLGLKIAQEDLEKLRKGIRLFDGFVNFNKVILLSPRTLCLSLFSGKNRVIRRVFEQLRYEIVSLVRTRQGDFTLDNLKSGDFRFLSNAEVFSVLTKK